jgi:threonylcarbamoyladenosine tRNA methylthiotransferase MtaB
MRSEVLAVGPVPEPDARASAPGRVAVRTLGCKVNRAESDLLTERLLAAGIAITDDEAAADVVVINSCTVTGEADAKTRKAVRRALAGPVAPTVVVTGCLAALDPQGLQRLSSRVVAVSDKAAVAGCVLRALESVGIGGPPRVPQAGETADGRAALGAVEGPRRGLSERRTPEDDGPAGAGAVRFRTRTAVKVQDGCDHRCAYCIVPDARGPSLSVPAAEVVERVAALVARGSAEVVLTGVNIGRWADPAGASDLATLVERVAATGVARIRISSIEPLDLTPRLLSTLAALPSVMPHLHVPLQSGSDDVLSAMRRGYTTRDYARALERARTALPGLAVTTDVIAGLPGESDADFADTLAFVEECMFTRLHVFRYSRRSGTPAAGMTGQVPPAVTSRRAAALRALGDRLADAHARSRVGGDVSVLVEKVAGPTAEGTSEDYLSVRLDTPRGGRAPVVGEVVSAVVTACDRGAVRARARV